MKKLAIIGTVGLPAKYGGFETLTHHLILNWKNLFDTSVYCCSSHYPQQDRPKSWHGARLIYLPFKANGWQSVLYDIISIIHALFYADVLLILGVSGTIILPLIKLISKKKILVNIDGQEWKRPKWNKWAKAFLKYSEKLAVKYSDEVITDNAALQSYVKKEYGKDSRLITYGGDHVLPQAWTKSVEEDYPFSAKEYAFKVARIEPENNIHLILDAYSQIPDFKLVVVGNWEHSSYSLNLRRQYASYPNLFLLDPIYEQKSLDILRSNSCLYIHGHQAGGTNPSLVEAMNLGLPIIAYDVSFNRESMKHQGMYFSGVQDLLARILNLEERDLRMHAQRMKELALTHYRWRLIAKQYADLIYAEEKILLPRLEKRFSRRSYQARKSISLPNYHK
ncbi:MAG: DUF1972 domain-containing protein [Bacteroidota bacterium]